MNTDVRYPRRLWMSSHSDRLRNLDSGIPNEMDQLYEINDALTELAHRFQVAFANDDEEDEALNDLTHEIGRRFRVGPYRTQP